jgi:hypothetical protein
MTQGIKRAVKGCTALGALVLVCGTVAPYVRADRYADRIRSGLETALGRRVELGDVRFKLFTGPGFSISKVVIHEDPAFGVEPFAYVESLEARARLLPLIAGRVEFASLRLEETSVNLTRVESPAGAAWNFADLSRRTKLADLPALHLRSGHINFKFGVTKSAFYVNNADLDVSPPSAIGDAWQVRFLGEPARTDRPARNFGSLSARGRWRLMQSGIGRLELDAQLEPSAMNDMISLLYGRDIGVHGLVAARAHLAGPLEDLHINGALNIEDLHRWDLLPQRGTGWPFEFEGHLNIPAERLELASHSAAKGAPPLDVRFRVADYLSRPHWGLGLNWNRFRMEPLLQLARHLGTPLPAGLKIEGTIDGAIGYTGQGSWQGQLAFQDAAVTIPDSPPVRFEQAVLLFDGSRVHLPQAVARTAGDDLARIEADYQLDTGELDLAIATDSMAVAGLRSQAALAAVPILEHVTSGTWKGSLRYQREAESAGEWSGAFEIANAEIPLEGLADPLKVEFAHARLDGARVALEKIRASVGEITTQADYRYEPGVPRPHRFRIAIATLDATELERLMMPTLKRSRGLIARALGFGRVPVPDWLRGRLADGTIQIDHLQLGATELERLRSRLVWNGATATFADITGKVNGGTLAGRLTVDLRGGEPAYRLTSRVKSAEWNGGTFDAEAVLDTSGIGSALVPNLRSEGSFAGRAFAVEPLDQFESVSGCYALDWMRSAPRLKLTDLHMSTDSEKFSGSGAMHEDGRLVILVSSGSRQLSMSGTPAQLHVDEGGSR